MSEMDKNSDAPAEMMGGAKRKNGHKSTCSCHICENMKNKARRGGYRADAQKAALKKSGGSRKKNGHSPTCGCPICKNMKNAKNAKKSKRGGEDPDIENQMGDLEEGGIKAQKAKPYSQADDSSIMNTDDSSIMNTDDSSSEQMPTTSSNQMPEFDNLDAAEKGEAGPQLVGGTRKRRGSRKSNGHKPGCGCPICKNMKKKSQKGGDDVAAKDEEYDEIDNVPSSPAQAAGTKKRRGNGHKAGCGCPICKNMRRGKGTRRHKKRTHKRR
jgi:hypothetical protein